MTASDALDTMKRFFTAQGQTPPEDFEQQKPSEILTESLDVVDFVVFLEEELQVQLDLQKVGESLMGATFGELASELALRY